VSGKLFSRLWSRPRAAWLWLEGKPVAIVVAAAGTTFGVVFVLASWAGWPRLMRVTETNPAWWWLVICLVGEIVAYAGYALTVRDMARVDDGAEMSLLRSAHAVVAGFGVFAATRSSGGFAVDYWAFQRAGASRREAAARAVGLGLLEYVVLSICALAASLALFLRIDGQAGSSTTLPSLLILPCLAVGWYLTSPRRARRLSKPQGRRVRRWFARFVAGATTVRLLLTRPKQHGLGVLGNLAYWAGDILCLWAALHFVHAHLSVAALVVAYAGGYVLTRRALPAGGAGFVEVALTFALVWIGLPVPQTVVAVIVYRLFNFWLPILPALILLPSIREMRSQFDEAEQPG
jgi:uncharacterized membrane protein YbhN (UPF0104 family)